MIKSKSDMFKKELYILYPGDYFVTRENCVIGTVTGSCVAVCIYDSLRKIGGMGHFIVPGAIGTEGIVVDEIARKGIANMEYLMGELVKKGGDRRYVKAKIFGAGYINGRGFEDGSDLSESNIRFIHEYFTLERIKVERSDLGGDFRRKIYFNPSDGTVYRRILMNNEESSEFLKLEKEYIDHEFRDRKKTGNVVIFQ